MKPNGIFCIEADWWNDLTHPSSVQPLLTLLNHWDRVPTIHCDVGSGPALLDTIGVWAQKRYAKYSILYLPFHGNSECLFVGDRRRNDNIVTLDQIEDRLRGKCHRRILLLSGCHVLATNGHRLNRFLRETDALAICGYKEGVDWLQGAAFELMVLGIMQRYALTRAGATAMKRKIVQEIPDLARQFGFRMVVRK